MTYTAICISCGSAKKRFGDTCQVCKFHPETVTDLGKSMMLSLTFDVQSGHGTEDLSKPWHELLLAGKQIAERHTYEYDPAVLALATSEIQAAMSITPRQIATTLVIWLLPVILVVLSAIGFFIWG